MRVIAGSARRLLLQTPEGMDTRPTQDRIKETLFNILQDDVPQASFLDLFAGSGGIGIEALSRGAKECVFVDSGKKPQECIKNNLIHTHLEDRGRIIARDVFSAIPYLENHGAFDIIFMDPPYEKELERQALSALKVSKLLKEDTIIIIEASLNTDFSYLPEEGYELVREKIYKTNKHVFVRCTGLGV